MAKPEMAQTAFPVHGEISGPLVIIGLGSIGRGALPLIERHFRFDPARVTVVEPRPENRAFVEERGFRFVEAHVTRDNYRALLTPLLTEGGGQGFCINLSVDTGSLDLMRLTRELGALYIDTVVEPWLGFYFDDSADNASRTNYALRETVLREKREHPGGATAVSCCGANPGMVSWFVKQALVDLAAELGLGIAAPEAHDREGWARLMRAAGVKGIHIAERDTQRAKLPKPLDTFWNTWSVEGFIAEGLQPAELGWGTHEKWLPQNARRHEGGCGAAIFLEQPGANTRVRTWCPTPGPQYGFLVTHNEAISIADFFTVRDGDGAVLYRPTCHYAYHPCNDAVLSLHEMFGAAGRAQPVQRVLEEDELLDGADERGVLIYGHGRNAYWFGSQLSLDEARGLAPLQNAPGLPVPSAVVGGMAWALKNPEAGIVDTDWMDYSFCLDVQRLYLGPLNGFYTDWTPLRDRPGFFPEDIDAEDPWQFRNILVR